MSTHKHWTTLALALAGILALGVADVALAKQGRGRGRGRGGDAKAERVKEKIGLQIVDTVDVAPRKARLRIRRKKATRNELRIQLGDATPGFDLDVWFADSAGTMTRIAGMRESTDDPGDYDWRVRTKKGQALPFGVSDVADLSGRALEVRNGSAVVARGSMPDIAPAAAAAGKRAIVRSPLSSSVSASGSDDAAGDTSDDLVQAEIRLRRESDREELKVEVEHVAGGLTLGLWIADDGGDLTEVGTLIEELGDDGPEYELTLRTDRDVLPFGLTSVSGLSGRAVEVRDGSGAVLASGFVPRLGDADDGDADDGDADDGDADDGDADDDDADDDDAADDDADDDDAADDDDGELDEDEDEDESDDDSAV